MKSKNARGGAIIKHLSLLRTIITLATVAATATPIFAQEIVRNITLDAPVNPNPMMIQGMSGGDIDAIEVVQTKTTSTGPCNGLVKQQPNHILILNSFFDFLKIEVESSTDTTLLVQGPGGVWCNDDYNNANPALQGEWQKGQYKLWVGSYDATPSNYRIRITGNNP